MVINYECSLPCIACIGYFYLLKWTLNLIEETKSIKILLSSGDVPLCSHRPEILSEILFPLALLVSGLSDTDYGKGNKRIKLTYTLSDFM